MRKDIIFICRKWSSTNKTIKLGKVVRLKALLLSGIPTYLKTLHQASITSRIFLQTNAETKKMMLLLSNYFYTFMILKNNWQSIKKRKNNNQELSCKLQSRRMSSWKCLSKPVKNWHKMKWWTSKKTFMTLSIPDIWICVYLSFYIAFDHKTTWNIQRSFCLLFLQSFARRNQIFAYLPFAFFQVITKCLAIYILLALWTFSESTHWKVRVNLLFLYFKITHRTFIYSLRTWVLQMVFDGPNKDRLAKGTYVMNLLFVLVKSTEGVESFKTDNAIHSSWRIVGTVGSVKSWSPFSDLEDFSVWLSDWIDSMRDGLSEVDEISLGDHEIFVNLDERFVSVFHNISIILN